MAVTIVVTIFGNPVAYTMVAVTHVTVVLVNIMLTKRNPNQCETNANAANATTSPTPNSTTVSNFADLSLFSLLPLSPARKPHGQMRAHKPHKKRWL